MKAIVSSLVGLALILIVMPTAATARDCGPNQHECLLGLACCQNVDLPPVEIPNAATYAFCNKVPGEFPDSKQ